MKEKRTNLFIFSHKQKPRQLCFCVGLWFLFFLRIPINSISNLEHRLTISVLIFNQFSQPEKPDIPNPLGREVQLKNMSQAENRQASLEAAKVAQETMPRAKNRQAALDAARTAHEFHFGYKHCYFTMQDSPDVDLTLANPNNMRPPLTYRAEFKLPGPPRPLSEEHLTAIERAEPPAAPITSITFKYWLPWDIHTDDEPPVQCTAQDCPLACLFHYKGLFMASGDLLVAPEHFGNSDPPRRVWEAEKRSKGKCPTDEDLKIVDGFAKYHYWFALKGYENSARAFLDSFR